MKEIIDIYDQRANQIKIISIETIKLNIYEQDADVKNIEEQRALVFIEIKKLNVLIKMRRR